MCTIWLLAVSLSWSQVLLRLKKFALGMSKNFRQMGRLCSFSVKSLDYPESQIGALARLVSE